MKEGDLLLYTYMLQLNGKIGILILKSPEKEATAANQLSASLASPKCAEERSIISSVLHKREGEKRRRNIQVTFTPPTPH